MNAPYLSYKPSHSNLHLCHSSFVSKRHFDAILKRIKEEIDTINIDCVVFRERSLFSLKMEWAVHNALYSLGICKDRTEDCDLDIPYKKIYTFIGILVWIFIY